MTKNKRLHVYAGAIIERYDPGWLSSTVGDMTIIAQLENIVGVKLRGKSTEDVISILANVIESGPPTSTKSSKSSKNDAYDHAMGVI